MQTSFPNMLYWFDVEFTEMWADKNSTLGQEKAFQLFVDNMLTEPTLTEFHNAKCVTETQWVEESESVVESKVQKYHLLGTLQKYQIN